MCSRVPACRAEAVRRRVGRVSVAHRATATNSIFVPFVIQKLLHHGTEGQHNFAVDFVEHLRKASVDGGEPTENSFVAGELFETRTCVNEIADCQEKEKNR